MSSQESSRKILDGRWDDNISWEFYLSSELPESAMCTSISCLAVMKETNQIVLTRNRRGWEMLGGHIEPGESLKDTLIRESMEEGGFYPSRSRMYGYRRISAKEPVPNEHHGGVYPPVTYIAHYLAVTDVPLVEPTGASDEIFERRVFSANEFGDLGLSQESLILAGFEVYLAVKNSL
jgi:8-oxo-dGTP pyrophosphatase MutT (NUDIX family)